MNYKLLKNAHEINWHNINNFDQFTSRVFSTAKNEQEKEFVHHLDFFTTRGAFAFKFSHQKYRDIFAQDFSNHLIEWEIWAEQNLAFDPHDQMKEIVIDSVHKDVFRIFFNATGEESPAMLFKFFSRHPLIQHLTDDISLDIAWGDGQKAYIHLSYVVGAEVCAYGFLPDFTDSCQGNFLPIDPYIFVWKSPNAFLRDAWCIDDLLVFHDKRKLQVIAGSIYFLDK